MTITLTTTTVCSSLDDLTDSLDALRELGVGSWSITGSITYDDRTEAATVLSAAVLDELSAAHALAQERNDAQEAIARGDDSEWRCPTCGAAHEADAAHLRAEIDRLRSHNDQLRDRIRDCEEDFLTMSRRRDDLALRIEGYEADLNGMQSIVDSQRERIASLTTEETALVAQSRAEVQSLTDRLHAALNEVSRANTVAEGRRAHIRLLDAALATERGDKAHMEAALNQIRSEMNPSCQCDMEEEVWSEHYDGCPVFKGAVAAMNHALELGIASAKAAQS